jgi:hypothetical protein
MDTDCWSSEDECDVVEDFQADSSNLWLWVLGAIALVVFFFLSYQDESSGSSSDVFVDDDDKYAEYAEDRNPNNPGVHNFVAQMQDVRFEGVDPLQFAPSFVRGMSYEDDDECKDDIQCEKKINGQIIKGYCENFHCVYPVQYSPSGGAPSRSKSHRQKHKTDYNARRKGRSKTPKKIT